MRPDRIFDIVSRYRAFRWGRHFRHPLCCVIRYCASLHVEQYRHRGGKRTDGAGLFVPCGVFHRADADYQPEPSRGWTWGFGAEIPFRP